MPLNAGSTLYYELLYLGWNDGVLEAIVNGEKSWNTFSGASGDTDAPPIAPSRARSGSTTPARSGPPSTTWLPPAVSLGTPHGSGRRGRAGQ